MATFTDSIQSNIDTLQELLGGIPPSAQARAKKAAVSIENAVMALQKDHPKDPAVALGCAFAIMMTAQRILEADEEGAKSSNALIQLL